jgi:UDPglucose 6-dehydrogenase
MHIAVIGSGYVGLVTGACLAEIGHSVILVDNDRAKYDALQRGECPIYERYLPELLAKHRGQRLSFSNHLPEAVGQSKVIFVAVGTPHMENGEADLSFVESVAREIAGSVNGRKLVVGKSTVPVYTADWVRRVMLLNNASPDLFDVASNPEFLREGTAVTDFLYPERIVIGADQPNSAELLREVYQGLLDGSYYACADVVPAPEGAQVPPQLVLTGTKTAELIKYACNAFLAMKISFINAVATICESVGANIDHVREGIGSDTRIGRRFLYPGIGYGGSCFPKDLSAYHAVARECGYDFRLLEEVMKINEEQQRRFLRKVRSAVWTLRGKRLGVLGLAFKGGTDDIRESPAVGIVQALLAEGSQIQAYDPAAMENAKRVLPRDIRFVASAYDAAEGADALLVLTEWQEFKELDLLHLRSLLRYPIVVDGRNLFEPETMRTHGFIYLSVGRADVSPWEGTVNTRSAASEP